MPVDKRQCYYSHGINLCPFSSFCLFLSFFAFSQHGYILLLLLLLPGLDYSHAHKSNTRIVLSLLYSSSPFKNKLDTGYPDCTESIQLSHLIQFTTIDICSQANAQTNYTHSEQFILKLERMEREGRRGEK